MSVTAYKALTTAIPPPLNLANIPEAASEAPCSACHESLCFMEHGLADPSTYRYLQEPDRIDVFPAFPKLKAGCSLCRLIRRTVRKSWAEQALEHAFGPVKEDDARFAHLHNPSAWDGKVRVSLVLGFGQLDGRPEEESRLEGPPLRGRAVVVDRVNVKVSPIASGSGGGWARLRAREACWKSVPFKAIPSTTLQARYPALCRRLPAQETLSKENLEMIGSWLRSCKEHERCHHNEQEPASTWLPTRLLDIGSADGTSPPRIVETKNLSWEKTPGHPPPYVALSHMWGDPRISEPPTQTLRFSYEARATAIPAERLARNFLDAIQVCRALRRQYIWIDSLCIIQDDADDWSREAALMHQVYRMADFTIVA